MHHNRLEKHMCQRCRPSRCLEVGFLVIYGPNSMYSLESMQALSFEKKSNENKRSLGEVLIKLQHFHETLHIFRNHNGYVFGDEKLDHKFFTLKTEGCHYATDNLTLSLMLGLNKTR